MYRCTAQAYEQQERQRREAEAAQRAREASASAANAAKTGVAGPVMVDADKSPDGEWFIGQFIEALDSRDRWIPAEILRLQHAQNLPDAITVLIHYEVHSFLRELAEFS